MLQIKGEEVMNYLLTLNHLISKYLMVLIIGFSCIAYIVPEYFTWAVAYTPLLLGIAMFGMGLTIKFESLCNILKHPREIFIGVLSQYTIMPLLAWGICHVFTLPPDIAIGVILVGCCPGGTASNVITYIAKGDVPLSVGMTITSTLIAPIVTPLLILYIGGAWVDIALLPMMITMVKVIIVPILLGGIIQYILKSHVNTLTGISPIFSMIAIILLIAAIIAINKEKLLVSGILTLIVVGIHNIMGLLLGLSVGKILKLRYDKTTALAIEVGMQNSGLAVTLATTNFPLNPLATLVGAIFSVWHNISGAIFASIRRKNLSE